MHSDPMHHDAKGATPRIPQRLPDWLRKRTGNPEAVLAMKKLLRDRNLHTVCQSAGCPNLPECFQKPAATFLILGNVCTRHCTFCGVPKGIPSGVDPGEPDRIAETVRKLGLRHAVVTSVTRDDLPDGGAAHFAKTVQAIRRRSPRTTVEVLIPDFQGHVESLTTVLGSGVDVLNHNVETIPRLYAEIRPEANFGRSVGIFVDVKRHDPNVITKSGLMVGLGETSVEVQDVFRRLVDAGCEALTIGQYLAPRRTSHPVQEFIHPSRFDEYRTLALALGFKHVQSGPFVRSSYGAEGLVARKRS